MICYTLLAIIWRPYTYVVITIVVIFLLVLPKIPWVRQKVKGDFKPKKLNKLGGPFSIGMEKELTDISLHFGRSG